MSKLLIFSATAGFRHESIPATVEAVTEEAAAAGHEVVHTEDPSALKDLDGYAAVVFAHVSGDVLDDEARASLVEFIGAGGGFAGIHGASTAERGWPEYEKLVGARFLKHPDDGTLSARVRVEVPDHPSTAHLDAEWPWIDEWYCFESNPRDNVAVLLTVDESDYLPDGDPSMGDDHPLAWHSTYGEGRTFYTALGHHAWAYQDPTFRAHIWGGIVSVLRAAD